MSCLYILDINTLLILFASSIFSYSVACLFIFSMIFFVVKKFLSSIKSHLFIFAFIYFVLGDRLKKKYCYSLCQRVLFQEFYGFMSYIYHSVSKNPDFKKGQKTQIDIFSKKVYR